MGILPAAEAQINLIGACIMQKKQPFTTTQPAQRLGMKSPAESEASLIPHNPAAPGSEAKTRSSLI